MKFFLYIQGRLKYLMKLLTLLVHKCYLYCMLCINMLYYIITRIVVKFIIKWGIIIFVLCCSNIFFFGYCDFQQIFELICSYFYNSLHISQSLIFDETMPSYEILSSKEIYKSWEEDGIIHFVHDENYEERAAFCREMNKKEKVYLDDRFYMVLIPYFFVICLFGLWFFLAYLETGSLTLEDPVLVAKSLEANIRARESGWETILRVFPESLMLKERNDRTEVMKVMAEMYLKNVESFRNFDEVEQFRMLRYVLMFWHLEVDRIYEVVDEVIEGQYEAELERFKKKPITLAEIFEEAAKKQDAHPDIRETRNNMRK